MLTQIDPEHKPHAFYNPPAGLARPAIINETDGDLARISYFILGTDIEMEGWVPLTDLHIVGAQTADLTATVLTVTCEAVEPEEVDKIEYCPDCGLPLYIGRHQIRRAADDFYCDTDDYDGLVDAFNLCVQVGRLVR